MWRQDGRVYQKLKSSFSESQLTYKPHRLNWLSKLPYYITCASLELEHSIDGFQLLAFAAPKDAMPPNSSTMYKLSTSLGIRLPTYIHIHATFLQ